MYYNFSIHKFLILNNINRQCEVPFQLISIRFNSFIESTQLIYNMYLCMNWNKLKLKWIDMELHAAHKSKKDTIMVHSGR